LGIPARGALIAAFLILAAFSYVSGLRAPALIALVKDILIYTTFIVAVIYIPIRLGGYGRIFSQVPAAKQVIPPEQYAAFSTLALGSALALFLYPHAITGVFGSQSAKTVKRNMALLPAYTFLLGLIALLGYMAIAAGIKASGAYGANGVVPRLFIESFPGWFVGFAFAAIGIGALVPASVMSIASANLFSRNIYKEFFRARASSSEEATVSKVVTLLVMIAALAFIIAAPTNFVINFQLAGGVWILQTLPAVFLALYIKWLDRWAIAAGWAVGIGWGTYQLIQEGFASSLHPIGFLGSTPVYIALSAVIANLIVVFLGTGLARLLGSRPISPLADADYEEVP
jgi:SSS family solute:Na+ symporter